MLEWKLYLCHTGYGGWDVPRGGCFVFIGVLALSAPALAQDHIAEQAKQLAQELLKSASNKLARVPDKVLIEPLRSKNEDPNTKQFNAALREGVLMYPGVRVVEKQSLEAVLKEGELATLGNERMREAVQEIAGAFGADVWLTGTLDRFGGTYRANVRAVDAATGSVLATAQCSFTESGETADAEALGLDAQLRMLSDQIAGGLDHVDGEVRYQTFAVMPFDESGETTAEKKLGTLVAAELTTLLRRDHNLLLVERAKVGQIIEELALSQTGLMSPEKSMEVGRLSGAQALVIGTVSEAGGKYAVNARVVETSSGEVVLAEKVSLPASDLIALSSEAVVLRSKSGALFRAMLIPGWGQFYNREPIKGGIFAGAMGLSVASAIAFHIAGSQHESKYASLQPGNARFRREEELAEQNYQRRNIFLIATAVIYALNVADAVLSGYSAETALP